MKKKREREDGKMVTASLGKKGGLGGPSYSGVGLDPRRTPVICTSLYYLTII